MNVIADIEGLSRELLEHFSTRRAEILEAEAYVARNGRHLLLANARNGWIRADEGLVNAAAIQSAGAKSFNVLRGA